MSKTRATEVENAIHSYCPKWERWARMIEDRQGGTPEFERVKQEAQIALAIAVKRIAKAYRYSV